MKDGVVLASYKESGQSYRLKILLINGKYLRVLSSNPKEDLSQMIWQRSE